MKGLEIGIFLWIIRESPLSPQGDDTRGRYGDKAMVHFEGGGGPEPRDAGQL